MEVTVDPVTEPEIGNEYVDILKLNEVEPKLTCDKINIFRVQK